MFLCERQSLFSVSWPFSHTDRIQLMFWIASVTWLGLSQTSAVEIFGKRSILDGWNGPESPLSFISKVHGSPNFTYNPGQNTWSKIKKSSKIGQNLKILISAFELFFLTSKFYFWKEGWVLSYISTYIWDFLDILLLPKILMLMSFGNLWKNFHFACG